MVHEVMYVYKDSIMTLDVQLNFTGRVVIDLSRTTEGVDGVLFGANVLVYVRFKAMRVRNGITKKNQNNHKNWNKKCHLPIIQHPKSCPQDWQ